MTAKKAPDAVFTRRVSANEQLYLSISRTFSHFVMQVVIEGKGSITADQLQTALDKVSVHFPGVRLALRRKTWVADAPGPQVTLLTDYPDFRSRLNQSIHLYEDFFPEQGRTCEVALARKGNDTLLVFRALHAVMDGQGLRQWVNAVFQALRGEDVPAATSTLTEDEFIRSRKAPFRSDEPMVPRCPGPPALVHSTEKECSFDYARRTIRGPIPAVTARLAAALRKLLCSDPGDMSIVMVPVDLRLAAPDISNSTANLSLPIFIPVGSGDEWTEISHRLISQLEAERYLAVGMFDWLYRLSPASLLSWLSRKDWQRQIRKRKYYSSAVVSHIGMQDLKDYRTPDFLAESICFLPCVMPVAPLSFVVTEYASCTEICVVKGRPLWNEPGDVLDEVLRLAGLNTEDAIAPEPPLDCIFGLPIAHTGPVVDIGIRITEAAKRYNDRVALTDGISQLTYADFIAKRDNIAAAMTEITGRRLEGERVVLLMNRSIDAFMCIHACLALNAVFVPIDPQYPAERIKMMLDDARPALLVHDGAAMNFDQIVALSAKELLNRRLAAPLPLAASVRNPSDLAYIVYTSGTTGAPKGVCVTRSNLSHYVHCAEKELFLPYPHKGVPLVTSLSFDITVPALFVPLLQGCKVKVIRESAVPLALQEVLDDPDMTFTMMTPSHLQIMMGLGRRPASQWQCLAVGGEPVSVDLCRRALAFFGPQIDIFNVYGPTETTVTVTHHRFDAAADLEVVPIAKGPIECASLYLLKEDSSPCKAGEEGEIYIGGHTVSNGYWKDPAKTSERFLPDPFLKQGLMYRTGDRGVCRNGAIYFRRRQDEQVKVNGYRIELEEITTRLKQFTGIASAVVILDQPESKAFLRAFYTVIGSQEIDSQDLMRFLGQWLPRFMIPSAFHRVDAIPLTITGKVDRQLLASNPNLPETDVEETNDSRDVGDVWSKRLGVPRDQLSLESDFFQLGGNSMLLIEVLHDIDRELCGGRRGQALLEGLKSFLMDPRLARMARLVEDSPPEGRRFSP